MIRTSAAQSNLFMARLEDLSSGIELTNEPPTGILANLRRSFALFSKDELDDRDTKAISALRRRAVQLPRGLLVCPDPLG